MTRQELFELMDKFESSNIWELRYETEDEQIMLCKQPPAPVASAPMMSAPVAAAPVAAPAQPAAQAQAAPAAVEQEGELVTAPLVGTFYAAPSPDAEPFVSVGKKIKKGDAMCILEAMKMLNEVPAPCDCEILEVLAKNDTLMSFGQPLFRIREI